MMQLIPVSKAVSGIVPDHRMPYFCDSDFELHHKPKDLTLLLLMIVANPTVRINGINERLCLDGHA